MAQGQREHCVHVKPVVRVSRETASLTEEPHLFVVFSHYLLLYRALERTVSGQHIAAHPLPSDRAEPQVGTGLIMSPSWYAGTRSCKLGSCG